MKRSAVIGLLATVACALTWVVPAAYGQSSGPTPPAPAYRPITVHSPNPEPVRRWAERTVVAGDVNADGVKDMWVGVPRQKRGEVPYGHVYGVSGAFLADPQGQKNKPGVLWQINYPEPQPNKRFGFWVVNLGDVDGDGVDDVAIGTDAQDVPVDTDQPNTQVCKQPPDPEPNRCHENQGKAWVFSGKTNKVLYDLDNPHPQGSPTHLARFGSRLGRAGDINGDGRSEVIAGASGNDRPAGCSDSFPAVPPGCRREQGQAFIFDGGTGKLIRELNLPPEDENPPGDCRDSCGDFGLSVQGPGDVDGDGVGDQLVGAGSLQVGANPIQGRQYVFSGATGKVIRKIDDPDPTPGPSEFGFQDVTPLDPGDVNNDGYADLYGHGFLEAGATGGLLQGRAWVFSGSPADCLPPPLAGCRVLYELKRPADRPAGMFGFSMTRERELTDATRDRESQGTSLTTNPLYVGGDPHFSPVGEQCGETNLFAPDTGAWMQSQELPPPWSPDQCPRASDNIGPNLGWNVSSPGDLNRDGFRDFVSGAPFTDVCRLGSTGVNRDQGIMMVFLSSPLGAMEPSSSDNPPCT